MNTTTATSSDPAPARDFVAFRAGLEAAFKSMNPTRCFRLDDDVVDRLYHENQDQFDRSRLYYKAHITIAQPDPILVPVLEQIAREHDWRVSTFLMLKDGTPEPEAFISAWDESFRSMCRRVRSMRALLDMISFKVLQAKIEDTLLDTNLGDEL